MQCFELLLFKLPILTEILEVLKLPFDLTNAVQNPTFTLSDFYGSWIKMQRKLKKLAENENTLCEFTQQFAEKVNERSSILINNTAMISAVYLDPRYRFTLTDDEIAIAKTTLLSLFERVKTTKELTTQPLFEEDPFEDELVASGLPRTFYEDDRTNNTAKFNKTFDITNIFESLIFFSRQNTQYQ